jgi:hypothetical protein
VSVAILRKPLSLTAPGGVAVGRLIACAGKFRFASFQLARTAADRGTRSREVYAGRHAYPCNHCGGWHVGTTDAGHRKAAKAHKRKREHFIDDEAAA